MAQKPSSKSASAAGIKRKPPAAADKATKLPGKGEEHVKPSLIVAVGASAGGLSALKLLVEGLSQESRACLIVAQHVSPSHDSLLRNLLSARTDWTVKSIEGTVAPQQKTIFVVPPNRDVTITNGLIVPTPVTKASGPRPSIDRLFFSLASEIGERAVAIILSGSGSDGAEGVRTVKDAGGTVFAQSPESAQFSSMPEAAIQTGSVDSVLTPEEMGDALERIAAMQRFADSDEPDATPDNQFREIKSIVRRQNGLNLDHYKASTVMRRIRRRAVLAGLNDLADYIVRLSQDREEVGRLAGDLSVRVTSFLRDPQHFEKLKDVIDQLCAKNRANDVLRVWVPGCASGEEAYSITMLFFDALREHHSNAAILVFVSDMDSKAVGIARAGVYHESAVAKLPDEWLTRYFEKREDRYHVTAQVKQSLIFATQNVIEDPPFSKLDLISCRNLLIYLEPAVQRHVLAAFHYALKIGGYLFLGGSESAEAQRELFEPVNMRARLYRRTDHPVVFQFMAGRLSATRPADRTPSPRQTSNRKSAAERGRDIIATHYAPPAVVIDESDRILHFVGDLSPYITLPRGPADWTIHQLLLAPLNAESRALLHRCRREGMSVRGGAYTLEANGQIQRVVLAAHPDPDTTSGLVMLAFEARAALQPGDTEGSSINIIRELEQELTTTREHLQTVVEEVETSNEELQTVNEELQSSNEELQSTNEELQTSNEELTSINEELLTVNDELSAKTAELEFSRADLFNVRESLPVALIVVDEHLMVQQFNEQATAMLFSETTKPGNFLGLMPWKIPIDGIVDETSEVARSHRRAGRTIETADNRAFRLQIVPYRVPGSDTPRGAVLTFSDVSDEVAGGRALAASERQLRTIIDFSPTGTLLVDEQGIIRQCNSAIENQSERSAEQLIGTRFDALFVSDGAAVSRWRDLLSGKSETIEFDAQIRKSSPGAEWMSVAMRSMPSAPGKPAQYIAQLQNITSRKQSQQRLVQEHLHMSLVTGVARRILDLRSLAVLQYEVVSNLAQVYDDVTVSYLQWREDAGFVVASEVLPGGRPGDVGRLYPIRRASKHLRRLMIHEPAHYYADRASSFERDTEAFAHDAASVLDAPVFRGEALVGTIRLQSTEARNWTDFDSTIMLSLADLISIAEREAESAANNESVFRETQRQRKRMEVTLSSIGDGVITTTVEGQIDFVNPAAEEMLGMSQAECIGKSLFNVYRVIRGETGERVPNVVEQCLASGSPIEDSGLDLYLIGAQGRRLAVNHTAAPIRAESGVLGGAIVVFRDVSDSRMLARELSYRAAHDPLTGLPNRDEFERLTEDALKSSRRTGVVHALLFIDLDRFKQVNDSAGHSAGDALLKLVTEVMKRQLRDSDTLARVGGDEFAVLLPRCPQEKAEQIAQQLVTAVGAMHFEWQDTQFGIGASIGLVVIDRHSESLHEVIEVADAACYEAKRSGRSRVIVGDRDSQGIDRATLARMLRLIKTATQEESFEFTTRPALPEPSTGRGPYLEMHPQLPGPLREMASVERVWTLARRHNLLNRLDRAAVTAALRHAAQLYAGSPNAIFGISLAAETVADSVNAKVLIETIRSLNLPPKQICFEIPEAALTQHLDQPSQFLIEIRDLGCKVAMDNFGSQFGSFSVITAFALDFVKVKVRRFADGPATPPPDRAILEALCHVCHRSQTLTIGVGVDIGNQNEVTLLREVGIDYLQNLDPESVHY